VPLVRALNDLLARLSTAFAQQRNFVADAAHELRSPLTALQLQLQLLERSSDPAERTQLMQELAAGVARTARLIRQLLHLSRAAIDEDAGVTFERARLELGALVRSAVARSANEAEQRRIDLGAEARDETWIYADAVQIEILLGNLIENALRYTPAGGVVDVVASMFDGAATLRVIDSGPGIAEPERVRVFDRFYRSPDAITRDASGSGLGLAIVKAIADKHYAQVSLHEGHAGIGLEVRVVFPKIA
ncbi:MAG: ATP-binding protein, partial [Burkholderiales bacterium]